jgi:hypothetical protein
MKITKTKLKEMIREELLNEAKKISDSYENSISKVKMDSF